MDSKSWIIQPEHGRFSRLERIAVTAGDCFHPAAVSVKSTIFSVKSTIFGPILGPKIPRIRILELNSALLFYAGCV